MFICLFCRDNAHIMSVVHDDAQVTADEDQL